MQLMHVCNAVWTCWTVVAHSWATKDVAVHSVATVIFWVLMGVG